MSQTIGALVVPPTEKSLSVVHVLADTVTFVHRSIRHSLRSVDAMMTALVLPLLILLMFVYVFGGALDPGGDYLTYVVPGIILLCAGFGSADTSVTVATDMTTGVIDRFRSLPVAGVCVLVGHVVATLLRNLVSTVVVLGVAIAIGFRPTATAVEWLAVAGILVLFMSAIGWLAAAFGLIARSAQGAAAFAFIVMFLPYVSSAFVPPSTMPGFLRGIAEHQPVTPVIETLRALMTGTPIGSNGAIAVIWCVCGIALGAAGSAWLFGRRMA
jgi:ABC-2 type transport system permease protein